MDVATSCVHYRTDKDIPADAVHALFRRSQWNDWFSLEDTAWYLGHTLGVISAWSGTRAIGLATLTGDGRISVELSTLIVDEAHRGQGIGSELLRLAVERVAAWHPYSFKVEVFEERTELRLYGKFGFRRNTGTWLLEYGPLAEELGRRARQMRRVEPQDAEDE